MNDVQANPLVPEPEAREGGWSRRRWLAWVTLVFAAQVAIISALGEKHFPPRRVVTNVPQITLADGANELIVLNDPTLFALPHPMEFASAFRVQTPALKPPSFRWTEPSGWLPLSSNVLGAVFDEFMQTNRFTGFKLQLKSPLEFSIPVAPTEPALAPASTLRIEGDLAQRRLLDPVLVPSLPYPDVIAPSRVQVLVDAAGNVVSAVVLPPDNPQESAGRYEGADRRALELARTARFAPGSRLTLGRLIFNWHTVPLPATNRPAASDEPSH